MSSSVPASSLGKQAKFECPLSLENMTSQDATVISCGHHFSKQGIYEYLNSKGVVSSISDLFAESVQERLQSIVVICPLCERRIRSVSDSAQFREAMGIIKMLSRRAIPREEVSSAASAAASSALSAEAPSAVAISSVVPSPLTVIVRSLSGLKRTYHVSRNEKFSRIWKNIIENQRLDSNDIITFVNKRSIYPWEPISSYAPLGENELTVDLTLRLGKTPIPEFIDDLARSSLGPTASADDIHALSVKLFNQAIDASLQKLEE